MFTIELHLFYWCLWHNAWILSHFRGFSSNIYRCKSVSHFKDKPNYSWNCWQRLFIQIVWPSPKQPISFYTFRFDADNEICKAPVKVQIRTLGLCNKDEVLFQDNFTYLISLVLYQQIDDANCNMWLCSRYILRLLLATTSWNDHHYFHWQTAVNESTAVLAWLALWLYQNFRPPAFGCYGWDVYDRPRKTSKRRSFKRDWLCLQKEIYVETGCKYCIMYVNRKINVKRFSAVKIFLS